MENNKINYVGIIGCVILYAVTSFAKMKLIDKLG